MRGYKVSIGTLAACLFSAVVLAGDPGDEQESLSRLPGVSGADSQLQRGAANMIWILEGISIARQGNDVQTCVLEERRIINTEVLKLPKRPGKSPWVEKWTVDRCGELVYYSIKFTPTPKTGGTEFNVSLMDEE